MRTIGAAALLLLAGAADAVPRRVETIRYETGPCFIRCPAYAVTVSSDGRGLFEPQRYTAIKTPHHFRVRAAQFAAFRARLRSVRPTGEVVIEPGKPLCRDVVTEGVSVDVRWTGERGDPRHLSVYLGCNTDGYEELQRSLLGAPEALPIAAFIRTPRRNAMR